MTFETALALDSLDAEKDGKHNPWHPLCNGRM